MKNLIIKIAAIYTIIRRPVWTLMALDRKQLTNCIIKKPYDVQVIYKGKPYISKAMIRNVSDEVCTDEDLLLSKTEYEAGYEIDKNIL